MSNHYTATFSNGQTISRTSEREYKAAGAYVNQETGQIKGETFSASTPKETRVIFYTISRRAPYRDRQWAEAENAKIAKSWKWEIVPVEVK